MYTEMSFYTVESGFDAGAIDTYYAGLPIAGLLEAGFADTCVNGALSITETNIMGAIKLILQGSYDFSELEGTQVYKDHNTLLIHEVQLSLTIPQGVPRVVRTTGAMHSRPTLPNCQPCINSKPTVSIG